MSKFNPLMRSEYIYCNIIQELGESNTYHWFWRSQNYHYSKLLYFNVSLSIYKFLIPQVQAISSIPRSNHIHYPPTFTGRDGVVVKDNNGFELKYKSLLYLILSKGSGRLGTRAYPRGILYFLFLNRSVIVNVKGPTSRE
jgi:hypothetical protein